MSTPHLQLRLADENDIPQIIALRLRLLQEAGNRGDISDADMAEVLNIFLAKAMRDGRLLVWLVLEDQDAVACCAANIYERLPHRGNLSGQEWYISNMYTLPQHRRRGFARSMVHALQKEARERCVERVWLEASPDGRHVYEQCGFVDLPEVLEWKA